MKNIIISIILLTCCCWFDPTYAASIDCNKQKLEENEEIVRYLYLYAEECIQNDITAREKKYKLTNKDGSTILNDAWAWQDISKNIEELVKVSDEKSQMKSIYDLILTRASAAYNEIEVSIILQKLPEDISLLRKQAWSFDRDLILLNINNHQLINVGEAILKDCNPYNGPFCEQALKTGKVMVREWKIADKVGTETSKGTITAIYKQVNEKNAKWNKFLYDSKPMLPLDIILTDGINGAWPSSDQYKEGFREPPATQWFLLHPSVGMEYVPNADDGEQFKPMLYVEVIGANRWDEKNRWLDYWGLRTWSGLSFVASFADRAGVEDFGGGAVVTFENIYSVGVTQYGGDTGYFLSLDLANLWRDKYKPRWDEYKSKVIKK